MTLPPAGPLVAKVLAGVLAVAMTGCGAVSGGTPADEVSMVEESPGTAARDAEGDWLLTVYYTAVEEYFSAPPVAVTGRPSLHSEETDHYLGSYPEDFVGAVRDEGTGRITSGEHAGEYLNWSSNTGFWLDVAPRDAAGGPLEPYVSAASDALERGVVLRVTECGREKNGSAVADEVCEALRAPTWEVRDKFTPGLAQTSRHLDLYIGEQEGPDFTSSPRYATLEGSSVEILDQG